MPKTWNPSRVLSLGFMAFIGLSACGGTALEGDALPALEVGGEGEKEAAFISPCAGFSCSAWSPWYAASGYCSNSSSCPVCVLVSSDPYCQARPGPISASDGCCAATGPGLGQVVTYERYKECTSDWGESCTETQTQTQLAGCGC